MKKTPLIASLTVCLALTSCGTTIVGSLNSTTTSSVVTTTTIPTGTVTSLLNEMLVNVTGLGNIIAGKDMTPAEVLSSEMTYRPRRQLVVVVREGAGVIRRGALPKAGSH